MKVRTTVAILNYNGRKHLEAYLPSVLEHTNLPFGKVLVIDNGSTDDSVTWIKQSPFFNKIDLVELPQNLGFADGYNQGLKVVDTEFILLLNSDVRVTPNYLQLLLKMMDDHPQVAVSQPKILSDINPKYFDYSGAMGGWIDCLGIPFAVGRLFKECEQDEGQYNTPRLIAWACGAALMIRTAVYREVNGMDPFFFAHQEEIDMCWRIATSGYLISNCPASVVYHLGGGTLPTGSPFKYFLNVRNNLVMLYKNLPWQSWLRIFAVRLCLESAFSLVELLKGNVRLAFAIIRAYVAFFRWIFSPKQKLHFPSKKQKPSHGYYKKSIVVDYYLKGATTYDQLRIPIE